MIQYIAALISILLGSFAQYFFKIGLNNVEVKTFSSIIKLLLNFNIIIGIALYGISLLIWFYVLSLMELSKAYPLVSLGYVFTMIIAYLLLNEPITTFKVIGLLFIILGVIFISKS